MRQLTPIRELQDLRFALRFGHLIKLFHIGTQSSKRLCTRGRGMNQ
jgi:hypothetical protein